MIRKQRLNDYRFWASRVAFGLAAMAMSTLTVGALAVLPERLERQEEANAFLIGSRSVDGSCAMRHADSGDAESH
jgi:hypothetical protein